MPKFVIERGMPGAGNMSAQDLQGAAAKSNEVVASLGKGLQWVESYVTPDKVYCVYIAPNEELIKEHAAKSGFPADRISQIKTVFDPTTAEG